MSEEKIIKMLNCFPQIEVVKYIMNLQEQPIGHLFTDTNWEDLLEYDNTTWISLDRFKQLQQKYNQALTLLANETPCEIDDFMNKNTDYCFINCGVDDEVFKKCWDKFIEDKLKGGEDNE